MNSLPSLILASRSPRRQQLLRDAGFDFTVQPQDTDESFPADLPTAEIAPYLAAQKAAAFAEVPPGKVLLTADTVVVLGGQPLNKPADTDDARRMLRTLSGSRHTVYTGVCLRDQQRQETFADATHVYFRPLQDAEIDYYIAHYQPFDKAGAYGAQEWIGLIGVERLEGSYFNVMGLPVHRVYAVLQNWHR